MVIKKSEHDILEISRITLYNTLTENVQIKKKLWLTFLLCCKRKSSPFKKQNQQVYFQGRLQISKYITSSTNFIHRPFLENIMKNKQLCENK